MKAKIAHRIRGRARFVTPYTFSIKEADALRYIILKLDGVREVNVHYLNGNIIINYDEEKISKICRFILDIKVEELKGIEIKESNFPSLADGDLFTILRDAFEFRFFMKNLMPAPLRMGFTLLRSLKYAKKAASSIRNRRLDVDLLDATAIYTSIFSRDFKTASSIMFLLGLGEKLEDWTYKKSTSDLARSLSLNVDKIFVVNDGKRTLKRLDEVNIGDEVEITMGNTIPVDGEVVSGIGMVNQSSFTGESEAVKKTVGKSVFAATVLEEGKLIVRTTNRYDDSRIKNIIEQISQNEKNKSVAQKKAETMADSLVKYSFIGAISTFLLSGNFIKAKSFLMVDYSCALKLAIPIAVMRAMRQGSENQILIKGGKFLEKLAKADTIVFDKTGTLTKAMPVVEEVIAFGDNRRDDCLRIAACLEEHFPHSIASAVVKKAKDENLEHEEMHSEPEYIVAHGIASTIDGKRALIGSEHFVLEDENVEITEDQREMIERLKEAYSILYLAYDSKLMAILLITDPIREDAKKTIRELRNLGFKKIAMLTGDHENAASHVFEQLELDYYKSQVLPEDKAEFIKTEKKDGRTVIMIGDGINDSVALSLADVGISMYKGADIAREVSDIAIGNDDLSSLIDVIKIARALNKRIDGDYKAIIGVNSALIGLGVLGFISNTNSSLIHNSFTIYTAFKNMREYSYEGIS